MARIVSTFAVIVGVLLAFSSVAGVSAAKHPTKHPAKHTPMHKPQFTVPPGWPKQLMIPRLGVNAAVESVAFNSVRDEEAPFQWGDVAWYDRGPRPGAHGRAQIYGHLDSTCCPAVFYELRDLKRGDHIEVKYKNGQVLTFWVVWLHIYWDNELPAKWMYQNTNERGLILLTCSGVFHYNGLGYDHKLLVYARAITSTKTKKK